MRYRGLLIPVVALDLLLAAGGSADPRVGAVGVVSSDSKVEVKSKVAAPIRRIPVAEGDAVRAGQLLVEMANDVQRAQVEAARAEVERSKAAVAEAELQLEVASRELERNLKVPDLITEKELEQSKDAVKRAAADLKTRRSDVARAEGQLTVAQASLDDTSILAPFDGIVSRIYLRSGATPKVADTTIVDLLTLDRLYVEVALPLPYLHSVRVGMPVDVVIEDEHGPIKTPTRGKVRYVYPEVDATTRMFRVKVHVDQVDLRVLPGMLAKVSVTPTASTR
jgi:RND family efflux transporter MFP subunit